MKTNSTIYRGQRIKEMRENKKLSLRELAELVSKELGAPLSHSAIRRYEEGSACDVDILKAICDVLGYDIIELMKECIEYDKKYK